MNLCCWLLVVVVVVVAVELPVVCDGCIEFEACWVGVCSVGFALALKNKIKTKNKKLKAGIKEQTHTDRGVMAQSHHIRECECILSCHPCRLNTICVLEHTTCPPTENGCNCC